MEESDGSSRKSFSLGEAYLALQKYENDSKVIAQRLSTPLYSGRSALNCDQIAQNPNLENYLQNCKINCCQIETGDAEQLFSRGIFFAPLDFDPHSYKPSAQFQIDRDFKK